MGLIPNLIGAIIYTVLQFIIFLFVLIATPLPMFKPRSGTINYCQTLWGETKHCDGSTYRKKGTAAFGCERRRNNMNGGAAFAIISIFVTLAALIFGIFMLIKLPCAVIIPMVLTIVAVVTILISWACVAGVMTENMCSYTYLGIKYSGTKYSNGYNYGAGFGLMVTAWCLEVLNLILIILLACL